MKIFRDIKSKYILTFCTFFIATTILTPKTHAIVVLPFLAVGIVQVLVWIIGVISLPMTIITKALGKYKVLKAFVFSLFLLDIFGILTYFGVHFLYKYFLNVGVGLALGTSTFADLTLIKVLTTLLIFTLIAIVPTFVSLSAINYDKGYWSKLQVIVLTGAISVVVGTQNLVIIYLILSRHYL